MIKREDFEKFKYGSHILSVFEDLFEDWMTEEDKMEMVEYCMDETGETIESIDRMFAVGVSAGYSPEQQVAISKAIFSGNANPTKTIH